MADLRDAALELAGHSGNSTFGTMAEEVQAVAALANGLSDGTLAAGRLDEADAQREYERIDAAHGRQPWEPGYEPAMPRLDPRKVAAPYYAPPDIAVPPVQGRQPAALSGAQAGEVDRLLSLSSSLGTRPRYGSASAVPSGTEREQQVALSHAQAGHGDGLALSASTRDVIAACARLRPDLFDAGTLALAAPADPDAAPDTTIGSLIPEQVQAGIADGTITLSRRPDGNLSVARRASYHGGPGQHEVTSSTRAHASELDDDPTDDLEEKLAKIRARHPDIWPAGDVTRGGSPDRAGTTSVRPKSPAQRARERRGARPGHTGSGPAGG